MKFEIEAEGVIPEVKPIGATAVQIGEAIRELLEGIGGRCVKVDVQTHDWKCGDCGEWGNAADHPAACGSRRRTT